MPKKRDVKDTAPTPSAGNGSLEDCYFFQIDLTLSDRYSGSSHSHSNAPSYGPPPPAHSKMVKEQYRSPAGIDPMTGYSTGMRAPAPYPPRSTPPSQNSRPSGGSIMQGTSLVAPQSLSQQGPPPLARTEGLLRPVAQGRDVGGSITQGTPILVKDAGGHQQYETPMNYYKNSLAAPSGSVSRMPYQTDPQLCSRQQIILSDYLLSQQMVGQNSGRRDREQQGPPPSRPNERPPPPPPPPSHVVYQYRPPSPMYVQQKMPYMDSHHPYPPHSGGPTAPMQPQSLQQQQQQQQPSQQPPQQQSPQQPPQQPTPPQQQQQRQGVIQRNSSVPASRPSDPSRPSPPVSHSNQGRTSSPGARLLAPPGRYPGMGSSTPVSISPRGDSIYTHDAFALLVNEAAAQPSLPVPERDRRDREREHRQNPAGAMSR